MRLLNYRFLIPILVAVLAGCASRAEPEPSIPATMTASGPLLTSASPSPSSTTFPALTDSPPPPSPAYPIVTATSTQTPIPETIEPPAEEPGRTITPQVCPHPDGWVSYTVQLGDTVFNLADRTGKSIDEVAAANCLAPPYLIFRGRDLKLPFLPPPYPTATRLESVQRDTETPIPPPPGPGILLVDPYAAEPGQVYEVTLDHFKPGETVTIQVIPKEAADGQPVLTFQVTVGAEGKQTAHFDTDGLSLGLYIVQAAGDMGSRPNPGEILLALFTPTPTSTASPTAQETLTPTLETSEGPSLTPEPSLTPSLTPTLTLTPEPVPIPELEIVTFSGPPGQMFTIFLTGFQPGEIVTLQVYAAEGGDAPLKEQTVNADAGQSQLDSQGLPPGGYALEGPGSAGSMPQPKFFVIE